MSDALKHGGAGAQLKVQEQTAASWRMAVEFAVDDGWRFIALYASASGPQPTLTVAFELEASRLIYKCESPEKSAPTIIDLVPAAVWDEREAHELFGWEFLDHEPMHPLVDHPAQSKDWTTSVRGDDVNQVSVGPIHAGVIESGHFRFHVAGERVLHLDLQLFYKHRGLEIAAEGKSLAEGLEYVRRACGADSVANSVAYADACESLLGLAPRPGLRRMRTVLLELERVYNHLNDISAIYAGVGFSPGNMLFAGLKERAQRLNKLLTGHRFLFDAVQVASAGVGMAQGAAEDARISLREIQDEFTRVWSGVQFAGSAQDRFEGVGVISRENALQLGAVGPTARAAGLAIDSRAHSPRLDYAEFEVALPLEAAGDVRSRFEMRGIELLQSFEILERLLPGPHAPGATAQTQDPTAIGVGVVESPRGRTVCVVEAKSGVIERLHLRTGSYANWPVLAHSVRGELIADFPLINKSFELCYACVDR